MNPAYKPLNDRQRRFLMLYFTHRDQGGTSYNASAAARLAGYAPKWAGSTGPRLLTFPNVARAAARLDAEIFGDQNSAG